MGRRFATGQFEAMWFVRVAALATMGLVGYPALAQTPQRLASLVPAATEVLYAIGAGDRVVGVGDYDDYPEAATRLPRLGGLVDPNLEGILAVRPDFVIVDPAQGALAVQLQAAGIETYEFGTGTIAAVVEHVRLLGMRLDVGPRSAMVAANIESGLAAVAAAVEGRPRPRVLVVFGRRPSSFAELWVSGGVGFLHDVVEIAGGANAFAEIERQSFKSGLEVLLARVPDVVVEAVTGADHGAKITAEWRALPGFAGVEVIAIDPAWTLRPSPRVVAMAQFLAAELEQAR